ncbi:hypothetical protein BS50DRAFT_541293 [Corynespora cassiicola Philippines]|uniref:Spindle pole body component n=1 Tax=Corynespora cassiicola Philippines TaxID=1448308 RepID=A0A2T2PCD8_CORCC|nr:hypothetical protein BS50DRAFT_541293 [Corynespora cassiicola Philippines]
MAQNARVASLTDELIQSIVRFDPETDRKAYRHAKELAARELRGHHYARTNQFDVQRSFAGLDEKFRVLNRDDLADALAKRVQELEGVRNKWIPECLSLLLQLSDRPTENSRVEALELLRPPTPPPPLTWDQILEEEPYSDEEIWKDIDYAAGSSEDEAEPVRKEKSKPSPPTSVEEEDTYDPEACITPVDHSLAAAIEEAQFWKRKPVDDDSKVEITEIQAVKETLFMLAGLSTSLYHLDRQNARIRIKQKNILGHAIANTVDHLLTQLASIGQDLYRLRQWTKRPSSLPLIQSFEAAVTRRLTEYDKSLALLQQRYLIPKAPISVSLLELHDEVQTSSGPFLRLARIVADIEPQLLVNPFVHLETLFDQITLSQMMLERNVFDFLSDIFFECLQTYLKPIRRWMENGELGANDETFFVFENDSGSEASSIWHDRFVLRRGNENALRCPSFLHPAAQKIFNTGKSVVFLKELGIYGAGLDALEPEPRLDHDVVCGNASELPLSPFPELFQMSFQTWIRSKYSLASNILREHLFVDAGLMRVLADMRCLYLGADGSVFQDFADAIFERMDTGQSGWKDRFLLTELARGILTTALHESNAEKLVVRSARTKTQSRSVKVLVGLSVDYALPWTLMNIIQRSSIPIYQQIFTFLLQTYRAKYLLQRVSLKTLHETRNMRLVQTSYKLRHRLIWFTDIIRSYLTETVINLSTEDMIAAMSKAEDIDEMSSIHIKYVARLQEQSLLSHNLEPIHKAIISLLDLSVVFYDIHAKESTQKKAIAAPVLQIPKTPGKAASKASRRKSFIPAIIEADSSDSEGASVKEDEMSKQRPKLTSGSLSQNLGSIDEQFGKLLPFVTAGLRNVGRVSAEPVWEMLAERLEWDRKKDRI